jgi:hypothetical protein
MSELCWQIALSKVLIPLKAATFMIYGRLRLSVAGTTFAASELRQFPGKKPWRAYVGQSGDEV